MTLLIVGIVVFFTIHLVPSLPPLRRRAVQRLGENTYKLIYTAVAAAGLILIIWGKATAGYVHLWTPPDWEQTVAFPLVLAALILLAASHMPGNIKRLVRHPMLWGVTLWALAHLCANGDMASLLLFGSFLVYSLLGIVSATLRKTGKITEPQPVFRDVITVVAGAVVFAVLVFLHPYLFGPQLIN